MFEFDPPIDLLANKTVLVTGASDGIGKVCAKTFVQYGATVILLGRNQAKLEKVYDEIETACPGKTIIHPLDFRKAKPADFEQLAASLDAQFTSLDGLVHNAAMLGPRCPIQFYPDQDWQDLMQVNVTAAFALTKALLPAMTRSADARLLFTSSSVGRIGKAYWGAYGISKFAIEGMMQTLADELAKTTNIKVNSLNPGGTRTSMRRDAYPTEDPNSQPAPESIMPVYLYLFSSAAASIHGQALDVRGFRAA